MDENTISTIITDLAGIIREELVKALTPPVPLYNKPLYTTKEAAAFLGVKLSYIYELIREHKISYSRSKGGKMIYIRQTELKKWAQAINVPSLQDIIKKENI